MLFQSHTVSHLVSSCGCRMVQPPIAPWLTCQLGTGVLCTQQLLQWHWALRVGTSTQPGSMQAVISPRWAVQLPKLTRLVPRWGVRDSHVDLASVTHCGDLPSGVADGRQVGDHGLCRIAPDAHAEATGSHPAPYSDPCLHSMVSSAVWYICITLQSPLTPFLLTTMGT